jgi:hypothetical protein
MNKYLDAATDGLYTAVSFLTGYMMHNGSIVMPTGAAWLFAGLLGVGGFANQLRGINKAPLSPAVGRALLLALGLGAALLGLGGCAGKINVVKPAADATIVTIFTKDVGDALGNYTTALTLPGLTDAQKATLTTSRDCLAGVQAVLVPGQKQVQFTVSGLVSGGSVADIQLVVSGAATGGVVLPMACKAKVADMFLKGAGALAPVKLIQ